MQMHYFYDLRSMLSCTGAKGPVWASQRFRVLRPFSKLLKEFFVCHPDRSAIFALRMHLRSEGSAFLTNRNENAYPWKRA